MAFSESMKTWNDSGRTHTMPWMLRNDVDKRSLKLHNPWNLLPTVGKTSGSLLTLYARSAWHSFSISRCECVFVCVYVGMTFKSTINYLDSTNRETFKSTNTTHKNRKFVVFRGSVVLPWDCINDCHEHTTKHQPLICISCRTILVWYDFVSLV